MSFSIKVKGKFLVKLGTRLNKYPYLYTSLSPHYAIDFPSEESAKGFINATFPNLKKDIEIVNLSDYIIYSDECLLA